MLGALITIDVHARDVVAELVEAGEAVGSSRSGGVRTSSSLRYCMTTAKHFALSCAIQSNLQGCSASPILSGCPGCATTGAGAAAPRAGTCLSTWCR